MSDVEIVISSGNILSKTINFGKGQGGDAATGELFETLKTCVLENQPKEQPPITDGAVNNNAVLEITDENRQDQSDQCGDQPREELKVSVKIFLYSFTEDLHGVIQRTLKQTATTYLDTVILSFATPVPCDALRATWGMLEKEVQLGTIKMIGLSDIDTDLFIKFYAEAVLKPTVIQINLSTCCVVPVPLQEFCKLNHIQLLTHSDPTDILPTDKLELLTKSFKGQDEKTKYKVKWVVRSQIHMISRGVIASKGFITSITATSGN